MRLSILWRTAFAVVLAASCTPAAAQAPAQSVTASAITTAARVGSTEDRAAITQTALDYIEGYYTGNAERMERALHPDLAKRAVDTDEKSGQSTLDQMSALTLLQITKKRGLRDASKETQQKDVTILDIYGNAATVKIVATKWVDYLHIAKFNGRWVIVNVLWEPKH